MPRVNASPACCQCRARKLACSRNRPICTNCQKRGETCLFPLVPGGFKKTSDGRFVLIDLNDPNEIKFDIWEKNMRLKRMEESGIAVNPNDFKFTRNIKRDVSQLNTMSNIENMTIGAYDDTQTVLGTDTLNPSTLNVPDLNSNTSLNRWKRRRISDAGASSSIISFDASELVNNDSVLLKSNEIMQMSFPKLQDYTFKLVRTLKHMEQKLMISRESGSFIFVENTPVFNDLYDILFNSDYKNILDLSDSTDVIKKQIIKLKDRLQFFEKELELIKSNEQGGVLQSFAIKPKTLDGIDGTSSIGLANEISKDIKIENFDDTLFYDSKQFSLWKKNKQPFDSLYSLPTLIFVSSELQELKKNVEREVAKIEPENNDSKELENYLCLRTVSLTVVPFEPSLFFVDYFNTNFISNDVFPKKLFKIFESSIYKRNLSILRELNKEAELNDLMPQGPYKQSKLSSVYIDIARTKNSENQLLLEYNFIILICLKLIKNNNFSKTEFSNSAVSMINEFENKNITNIKSNVKSFFNWCVTYEKVNSVRKLKVLAQLASYVDDPLFYTWDLINVPDQSLMEFQINIIKSREQFLGLKSVIRLYDYDNRLLKQLSNNINLTDSKIDYILKELFKELELGKFTNLEDFFSGLVSKKTSPKNMIYHLDTFLIYLNYTLYWKYYKVINAVKDSKINTRVSRNKSPSKHEMLAEALKNREDDNEAVFTDLFSTVLNTFSNIIKVISLNYIDQQYSLVNAKINHILLSIVTIIYSLHHLNASLIKQILKNLKKFFILNNKGICINFKNEKYGNLLDLLDLYIINIEDVVLNTYGIKTVNEVDLGEANNKSIEEDKKKREKLTYLSYLNDFNDILLAGIQSDNTDGNKQSIVNDATTLTESKVLAISNLFSRVF
ncbi:hypothetical protein QEN19_001256 [Hanseniaspora menglaensis]